MNYKTPKVNEDIIDKLDHFMSVSKSYQDSELSLLSMSKILGVSKRKTSELIKQHYGKSFPDFLNDYRLQEVLKRFQKHDYKKHTIIAIALEAGFPSKSTFYRFFKKKLEISPSEFLFNLQS